MHTYCDWRSRTMQYNTATKATYTPTFVPNVANSWIIPSELIGDRVRFARFPDVATV